MAPKKGQKMSLNAFLGDSTLGSWADEMDALPTAPAPKLDDSGSRDFRGRDDFLSTRPDRAALPIREEVPLPTNPPFTAFVGNLAFDLTEDDLGSFFGPSDVVKGTKIIRDREDKPKGFGYVEFHTIEGLKEALAKNGSTFSHRQIRVNVAEPPKERSYHDDDKFAGSWRREGPLPDQGRDTSSRRRYDGLASEQRESAPDLNDNWRAHRPPPRFPDAEAPPVRRRGSGFSTPSHDGESSAADTEERWSIGSKFRPTQPPENQPGGRFGSLRGRGDMGPPSVGDTEGQWRRPRAAGGSPSPSSSVPPTPQLGRRKLELLPRSTSGSQPTSPQSTGFTSHKSNPFGAAKPVDVTAREQAVMEKIEREKEEVLERVHHSMSRQSSRQARGRPGSGRGDIGTRSPSSTPASITDEKAPSSPLPSHASPPAPAPAPAPVPVSNVRPSFSFASAAAGKKGASSEPAHASSTEAIPESQGEESADAEANAVADKLAEVNV